MQIDPDIPTSEIAALCKCPIDWVAIPGFGDDCPDALELLLYEWVRCVAQVAVSSEELRLIEDVLFEPSDYWPPEDSTVLNLTERRPAAVTLYTDTIGRLGQLHFLRPSEHRKHFSVSGPRKRQKKISYFYKDWQASTIANLFWSWFDDMMMRREIPRREGPIDFVRQAGAIWEIFRSGRTHRIAINTTAPVGELNGEALDHVAIDLDLSAKVAHAYPVTLAQAVEIMEPFDVRPIKSREH